MRDDTTHKDHWKQTPPSQGLSGILQSKDGDSEGVAACKAFGYLRGIRDHSAAVEFRFRNGSSMWFPYTWLGNWCFNPSEGLLVKFSGDLVYLVLIKGSNLDRPLKDGAVTLTHAGLQRHRLLWVREMTEQEIRHVGETEPTIDSIEIAGFESHAELKEWQSQKAPAFAI
jgi:hypothetical protein